MAFISDLLTATTNDTLDWCQRDPSAAVQKDFLSVKDFYRFDICVDPAVLNIYEKGILIQSFDTGLSELVTAVQAQDAAKKAAALAALDNLFT